MNKTTMVLIVALATACTPGRSIMPAPVNKEGVKAHKRSQGDLSKLYGRNPNKPNKFKKKHF